MKKIIFVLFTLLFCHISIAVNAKTTALKTSLESSQNWSLQNITPAPKSMTIANLDREIEIVPNEAIAYNNRAIAKVKSGNYKQAITDYTQAIDLIDKINLHADQTTVTVNNARKAGIYHDRGLVKLKLGNKRGAIDDLTLAAELFDEVGLMDISARSMQIVKTIDN
jgi:tetratricopeptide (TPR) repeat protein